MKQTTLAILSAIAIATAHANHGAESVTRGESLLWLQSELNLTNKTYRSASQKIKTYKDERKHSELKAIKDSIKTEFTKDEPSAKKIKGWNKQLGKMCQSKSEAFTTHLWDLKSTLSAEEFKGLMEVAEKVYMPQKGASAGNAHSHSHSGDVNDHSHSHTHADGTVHSHEHAHSGDVDDHSQSHTHADGTGHSHDHDHSGDMDDHSHSHTHADGTVHSHEHAHSSDVDDHSHSHTVHNEEHSHADGTVHTHEHDHDADISDHEHTHKETNEVHTHEDGHSHSH